MSMSLTAHILFGRPTRLPAGRIRTHNPDTRRHAATTPAEIDNAARNAETRLANVENVFNAIADGHISTIAIEDATGLSKTTVQKALHELEDWPSGPRIVRIRSSQQAHTFRIYGGQID